MKKYLIRSIVLIMSIIFMAGIKVEAKDISISAPTKTIYVKQKIKMTVSPSSMKSKVKWKSSDKKIASVSQDGQVTGKKPGEVKIYAVSVDDGKVKDVFKIQVKKFKKKTLQVKSYVIRDSYFPLDGKKYRVFNSKKEIEECLKETAPNGNTISQEMVKKLKQYKKDFFKKKSLCVLCIAAGSSSMPVNTKSFKLTQNKNGTVIGNLHVKIGSQKPDEAWTADVVEYYAVVELNKTDAGMIQSYKVKVDE